LTFGKLPKCRIGNTIVARELGYKVGQKHRTFQKKNEGEKKVYS